MEIHAGALGGLHVILQEIRVGGGLKNLPIGWICLDFFWNNPFVGFACKTWARLHRVSSGKRTKLDSMATIRAKIPHRNIVSEPEFFKNQTTNYPSLVSRRKSSFEGLNFEEITSFRSLGDEYGTISGLSLWCGPPWKQHHTETFQRSTRDDSFKI